MSLHIDDWRRLLEVAALTANEQDRRIIDALRYALANGDQHPVEDKRSSESEGMGV